MAGVEEPIAYILSGATTSTAEAQLTTVGERLVREGMLVIVETDDGHLLARVDSLSTYNPLYSTSDEWSIARSEGYTPPKNHASYSIARLRLLGLLGGGGGLRDPSRPPRPGDPVYMIEPSRKYMRAIYGVEPGEPGVVWYGSLVGYEGMPLALSVEALTMHLGVFGETGSGKSYGFGYLLELLSEIPVGGGETAALPSIIVDANADYIDYWREYVAKGSLGGYRRVIRMVTPISPARYEPFTAELSIGLDQFTVREVAEIIVSYRYGGELNEMQVHVVERALRELAEEGYEPHKIIVDSYEKLVDAIDGLARARQVHHQTARAAIAAVEKFHRDLVSTYRVLGSRPGLGASTIDEATKLPSMVLIDFSSEGSPGLPLHVKQLIVAYLARLLYTMFTRYKVSGDERYILFAIEEAQNYAPNMKVYPVGWSLTRDSLALIATQGRKFGICLAVVSQRPSFIDPIVLSMINTFIIHRLSPDDVAYVSRALGGLPKPLESKLTRLPRGYALVAGQANLLGEPILVRVGRRRVGHRMGSTRVVDYLKNLARRVEA